MTTLRLGAAVAVLAVLGLAPQAKAGPLVVGVFGDIATVEEDGSDYRSLSTQGNERHPSWSPDGKRIAFVRDFDLWVMNANGTNPHVIVNDPVRQILGADWSPTGRIIYSDYRESDNTGAIWSVADDGTDTRPVTDGIVNDGALDVSPDGSRIVFGTASLELQEVRDDGTGRRTLLDRTVQNGTQPRWSPDGTRIAYLGCPPGEGCGNNDIWTMNANGGSRTRLTTDPLPDLAPGWSADGTRITYSHFEHNVGARLRMVDATGANDHQVPNVPAGALYAEPQPPADEDLDGIRDDWETNGIDVTGDGTVDLDLPAMGADPQRKDIFIEIDFMPPHRPLQAAVNRMELAFAAAPVSNPDGSTGITLHVDNGAGSTMDPATSATWGSLSGQESLTHQNVLGSVTSGGQYLWTAFDALKTAHFAEARRLAFHYVIWAHGHSGTVTGIARDIPSSDFLVTLGAGCQAQTGSDCNMDEMAQAGTLMHELGHNLGLRHGGDDHVRNKPNYLSVMNYAYQLSGLFQADITQPTRLDYSRFSVGMNEASLNETTGFGVPAGAPAAGFLALGRCPSGALTAWPLLAQPVDFNCDGNATGTVAVDTNGDTLTSAFNGHEDWPGVVFRGGGIGAAGAGVPVESTPVDEPPLAALLANRAALEGYVPFTPAPTTPAPPGTPPPATPGATAPPALSGLRVRPGTLRRGRGAKITYTLSGPGSVRFTVERALPGRRRGRRCVAPDWAPRGRRCTRSTRLRGSLVGGGEPGANELRFNGRLRGRRLAPGRYILQATPLGADGEPGARARTTFRVA